MTTTEENKNNLTFNFLTQNEFDSLSAHNPDEFYCTTDKIIGNTDITDALGYTPANDSNVVHLSGVETMTSAKNIYGVDADPSGTGQANLFSVISNNNTANAGSWVGRMTVGAKNKTFLMGTYNHMCGLGAHSWTDAQAGTGAAWEPVYINPDGSAATYIGGSGWVANSGWFKVDNATGKSYVNKGTIANPNWQEVTSGLHAKGTIIEISGNTQNTASVTLPNGQTAYRCNGSSNAYISSSLSNNRTNYYPLVKYNVANGKYSTNETYLYTRNTDINSMKPDDIIMAIPAITDTSLGIGTSCTYRYKIYPIPNDVVIIPATKSSSVRYFQLYQDNNTTTTYNVFSKNYMYAISNNAVSISNSIVAAAKFGNGTDWDAPIFSNTPYYKCGNYNNTDLATGAYFHAMDGEHVASAALADKTVTNGLMSWIVDGKYLHLGDWSSSASTNNSFTQTNTWTSNTNSYNRCQMVIKTPHTFVANRDFFYPYRALVLRNGAITTTNNVTTSPLHIYMAGYNSSGLKWRVSNQNTGITLQPSSWYCVWAYENGSTLYARVAYLPPLSAKGAFDGETYTASASPWNVSTTYKMWNYYNSYGFNSIYHGDCSAWTEDLFLDLDSIYINGTSVNNHSSVQITSTGYVPKIDNDKFIVL